MSRFIFILIVTTFIACNDTGKKEAAAGFSNSEACVFSQISYCSQPQDTLNKYLPGWKIVFDPMSISGNYAFVATNGKKYAIVIRGSLLTFTKDAIENWIKQDLHVAVQVAWPYTDNVKDARVSQGAYDGWQNLVNLKDKITGKSIKQFLDAAIGSNTPLLITGHSLGGNLATIYICIMA